MVSMSCNVIARSILFEELNKCDNDIYFSNDIADLGSKR